MISSSLNNILIPKRGNHLKELSNNIMAGFDENLMVLFISDLLERGNGSGQKTTEIKV